MTPSPYSTHTTSLGLPEAVERAGAYSLLFVTGFILLMTEKNANVRHHAKQSITASIFIFLPLLILNLVLSFAGGILDFVPVISIIGHFLGLLAELTRYAALFTWLGLMLYAGLSDRRFTIPGAKRMRQIL